MNSDLTPRSRPYQPRPMFEILRLPLLCRWYQFPYRKQTSHYRQFALSIPVLILFKLCQLLRLPLRGRFRFSGPGGAKEVSFNALNTQFSALYLGIFSRGYEPEIGGFIEAMLGDDDTFADIGSNWGYFSILAASRPGFKGRALAFEPMPSTYKDLHETVEQCGLGKRVTCHPFALSNRAGDASMVVPDGIQSGQATLETGGGSGGSTVALRTLDSLKLERLDLVKIDAEGHELQVLEGGIETIRRCKPTFIFESSRYLQHLERTLAPMKFLADAGYVFFQPCWLCSVEGNPVFTSEMPELPMEKLSLALHPLPFGERFLRDANNIVACHQDRLPEVARQFQTVSQ